MILIVLLQEHRNIWALFLEIRSERADWISRDIARSMMFQRVLLRLSTLEKLQQ